jgi:hypothetical protein
VSPRCAAHDVCPVAGSEGIAGGLGRGVPHVKAPPDLTGTGIRAGGVPAQLRPQLALPIPPSAGQ